jgi:hypothetical protein
MVAIVAIIVAFVGLSRPGHVVEARATIASPVKPVMSGQIDYLPARFDESSMPRDPQPGQFSLVPGD